MKKYLAEAVGTFALVFCGTGAVIINDLYGGAATHAGVAITFGLIVLAMIYALGDISGAHINPAVTVAFWASGRFPFKCVTPYIVAQLLGAFAASGVLKFLFPLSVNLGATMPAGAESQSFILEIILTFFLMLVILSVSSEAKEKGITAGIAVGSVVLLEAMFAGPVSGASMNPARSIAPALLSGHIEHQWIYVAAPALGALLSVVIWKGIKEENTLP